MPPDSIVYAGALYQKVAGKPKYPRTVGYLSFILPLETLQSENFTPNFDHHTTSSGFPIGVNVLYSDHFGFSYEFTPTVKFSGGSSKMSNLLFDPGTMFRFDHGFTIITRAAFKTSTGTDLLRCSTRSMQRRKTLITLWPYRFQTGLVIMMPIQ